MGTEQTAALVLDIDGDDRNDFVIATRNAPASSMVWYRQRPDGWERYLIDATPGLRIEAGGAYHDIDGDGDLDILMGGDSRSNEVWWWENPAPNFDVDGPWNRYLVKADGEPTHHDQIFGDFDGDGQTELVFWNQGAEALFLAEIPAQPRQDAAWPRTAIYSWSDGADHEGLTAADIDLDGQLDIVGGGRWFKYEGGALFTPYEIDDSLRAGRVATGQFIAGGRPEVVLGAGDGRGALRWYRWDGVAWEGADLLDVALEHGHSLDVGDINFDGHLDIFSAEMRLNQENEEAKMRLFLGDGDGGFGEFVLAEGMGNHESRLADLDGDGDLDILGKPYNWETPRIDIWYYEPGCRIAFNAWERHVIDEARPWTAIFVTTADFDGDGDPDVGTGAWWYANPGVVGASWTRSAFGDGFNNLAAAHDFDRDGDVDVLGTKGEGSAEDSTFIWAENSGAGGFSLFENIDEAQGDFLQGVAISAFEAPGSIQVALSWHQAGNGLQFLTVPEKPQEEQWSWQQISTIAQDEGLSAGDIDRDGDADLLLGTIWMENGADEWIPHTLSERTEAPDRNRLVDLNHDNRLDAVIGYEYEGSSPVPLAWYEQPATATAPWTEHMIADLIGPMSLDIRDMDHDGDWDIIAGEHNLGDLNASRLLIYENLDSAEGAWKEHLVYQGDEHHNGARVVDLDGDGDSDIVSIGWRHDQVIVYENVAEPCPQARVFLPIIRR